MSATNRGRRRLPQDAYPTPKEVVRGLFRTLRPTLPKGTGVLDPCAGEGRILKVALEEGYVPLGMEIRAECDGPLRQICGPDGAIIGNGLEVDGLDVSDIAVVTNPPFGLAEEFIRAWRGKAWLSVFLLRLNFLASARRVALFREHPPHEILVLCNRPSFADVCRQPECDGVVPAGTSGPCPVCGGAVKPGSDMTEYAWFVWGRWAHAEPRVRWITT